MLELSMLLCFVTNNFKWETASSLRWNKVNDDNVLSPTLQLVSNYNKVLRCINFMTLNQ